MYSYPFITDEEILTNLPQITWLVNNRQDLNPAILDFNTSICAC